MHIYIYIFSHSISNLNTSQFLFARNLSSIISIAFNLTNTGASRDRIKTQRNHPMAVSQPSCVEKLFFAANLQCPDERNMKIDERPCIESEKAVGKMKAVFTFSVIFLSLFKDVAIFIRVCVRFVFTDFIQFCGFVLVFLVARNISYDIAPLCKKKFIQSICLEFMKR